MPDDDRAFAALGAFLDELHAGKSPDRQKLVAEFPELHGMLECLESLHRLVPSPTPQQPPARATSGLTAGGPVQFGNYELLGELGRGGMGVVYRARQRGLDRLVAIKMILASSLASPELVQRFHAEAKAAARLHHPNIVHIHEAGQVEGQHYFVMEHVDGPSLAATRAGRPMEPELAARLLADVARAVDYLHREGIVHRDLKPSNILLQQSGDRGQGTGIRSQESGVSGQGSRKLPSSLTPDTCLLTPGSGSLTPLLTDFGLAKFLGGTSDVTRSGAILGTPSYMAPEQAAGRLREVGPRSDVYSLGAILYEMLTGRPPFRADTPLDTLVQVIESEPPPPRQLNPQAPLALELICLKCLEKAPNNRYESAAALADDLDRYLRAEDVEAQPQHAGQRLWRWAKREPALASHLLGIVLFALVIQAAYMVTHAADLSVHVSVLAILAVWAFGSFGCQRGLRSPAWADFFRHVWAAMDALLLTLVLGLSQNATNPLVVFYALLIAGSGLWFRVPLVWFTTAAVEIGYAALLAWAAASEVEIPYPHHQVILMVSLAVLGFIVAHQTERVRALSRYYEQRRSL
jgi:serine/threonine-protein kinase